MEQEWGEDPNSLPPPCPFFWSDVYREASGSVLGLGVGRPGTALSVGVPSPSQDGDRATPPGHLHHHSSLETQQLVLGNTGGWEGPNPAFLVDFSFSFFVGNGLYF